jgi:hypothetical protein
MIIGLTSKEKSAFPLFFRAFFGFFATFWHNTPENGMYNQEKRKKNRNTHPFSAFSLVRSL